MKQLLLGFAAVLIFGSLWAGEKYYCRRMEGKE